MQAILLLPALAALCYGAALPQEWGSASSISGRPQPTFTIVVPCYPGVPDCVPHTYTIGAADAAEATAIAAREADPQVLISVSRTVLLPTPPPVSSTKKPTSTSSTKKPTPTSTKKPTSTSTKKTSTSTKKTHYKRQTLLSPSRTVLLPTPDPPSTTKKPTSTSTTKKPTVTSSSKTSSSTKTSSSSKTSSSTKAPSSTSTRKSTTKPYHKRQTLGSPSRTVLLPTAEPTTKVTTSSTKKPGHHTLSWPWWHPSPTSIHTVTVTVTQHPTSTVRSTTTQAPDTSRYTSTENASTRTIATTLVVPIEERQELGQLSRTVYWPPGKPPITYTNTGIVTVTYTLTQTVGPPKPVTSDSHPDAISSRTISTVLEVPLDKRQELGTVTRTVLLPTTLATVSEVIKTTTQYITTTKQTTVKVPTTVSVIKTTTDIVISVSTTTTCTEEPGTSEPYPGTSRVTSSGDASTRTPTATLTVPYEKRQVLGELPPGFSLPPGITLPTGATIISATPLPTRTYNKRQDLGSPSRSFTYIVPTTTGRVVTLYRDI